MAHTPDCLFAPSHLLLRSERRIVLAWGLTAAEDSPEGLEYRHAASTSIYVSMRLEEQKAERESIMKNAGVRLKMLLDRRENTLRADAQEHRP